MSKGARIAAASCAVALFAAAAVAVNAKTDPGSGVAADSVVTLPSASPIPSTSAIERRGDAIAAAKPRPSKVEIPKATGTVYLSVPAAGIEELEIVPYVGLPDDDRGTEINDDGLAGAPRGSWGGVAPGQVGNLMLTGHRTSAGSPMLNLPDVSAGDRIYVDQGRYRFIYVANRQMKINFRDADSRALQTAAVPGYPGRKPTRPAIVLSTCATPEDHADGNYWSDEHDNPTHRIDIFGFLESVQPRPQ